MMGGIVMHTLWKLVVKKGYGLMVRLTHGCTCILRVVMAPFGKCESRSTEIVT
jgi:hypothetical protein